MIRVFPPGEGRGCLGWKLVELLLTPGNFLVEVAMTSQVVIVQCLWFCGQTQISFPGKLHVTYLEYDLKTLK